MMSQINNMNRRNFISILGLGLGSVALTSTISGCGETIPQLDYGWNGPAADVNDIRLKVLSYAMLCPNPHNKQPWIIQLTGTNSFELYVDPQRLLPATDPIYRQIHIGQGTFLETLAIAATGLGHRANIEYFPAGMYSNSKLENKPVAAITLEKEPGIKTDPLFAHLLTRLSNKREYSKQPLSSAELSSLQTFHGQQSSKLTLVDSMDAQQKLTKVLTQAMQIEVGDRGRDAETIKMFRFNDDEIKKYRDGFGVAQSGVSGIKKILVENVFLSRDSVEKDPTAFGEEAVNMTQKAAASTATFGWLTTKTNSRLDQVLVGREYCRINLKTTAMGLAQHPMSQVLQEYPGMLTLQKEFKQHFKIPQSQTVQMLFRLGYADATAHGPRRTLNSIIKG